MLLTMLRLTKNEIYEAASFIAKLNKLPLHYIGYCGTDADDLRKTMEEDFVDGEYINFVVAVEHQEIIALIGFEIDDGNAEVWGPFCKPDYQFIQPDLWHFAQTTFAAIERYLFFIGQENEVQQTFVEALGATRNGSHTYFEITKQLLKPTISLAFEEAFVDAFYKTHTKVFPKTYYDADTILARFAEKEGTLLFYVEHYQLLGYSYFEPNGENECHLEYMAVDETKRGHGYGEKLLIATLYEIFKQAERVTLTVFTENVAANQLYEKTGFTVHKAIRSYTL
jgi:ribosomal protein S18 acetylase RimI-like enzyme